MDTPLSTTAGFPSARHQENRPASDGKIAWEPIGVLGLPTKLQPQDSGSFLTLFYGQFSSVRIEDVISTPSTVKAPQCKCQAGGEHEGDHRVY